MEPLTETRESPPRPRLSVRQLLWLGVTAVSLLALIVTLAVRLHQAQLSIAKVPPYPLIGRQAPDFTVTLLNGQGNKTLKLSDLRGKAVVLNFWASWCDACKLETPALQQISRRYAEKGLVVVGLAFQDRGSDATSFAASHSVTYPIGLDNNGEVTVAYGVAGVPETILITRDGKVLDKLAGGADEKQFDAAAQRLLAS